MASVNRNITGKEKLNFPYHYRIMLVDDEEEIREGIREEVDWNGHGFELVAEAANGQEALEMAKISNPDVVITDIRMPFMNGLELCQNLRNLFPNIYLVVLSGYDDFEYAQKAIQANVEEYLLKPVNFAEFTVLMNRIREKLDERFAKQYDMERLKEQYEASLPALREQYLVRLFSGKVQDAWSREKAQELKFDVSGEQWVAGLIRYTETKPASEQSELIPHLVRQLAAKELPGYCPVTCFLYQDYVAVLASLEGPNAIFQFMSGMRQMCLSADRFLQLKLAVGIGSPCKSPSLLYQSALEAENALDYHVLMSDESVIYINDIEPQKTDTMDVRDYSFSELLTAVRLAENSKIEQSVRLFLTRLCMGRPPLSQYRLTVMELATELLRIIRSYELEEIDTLSDELVKLTMFKKLHSSEEFEKKLIDLCCQISGAIRYKRNTSSRLVTEEAKLYIQENYANPELSLELVCAHLHLSSSYFSTLFKQETGSSFVNYLTSVRLTEAANLLDNTNYQAREIAQRVGYSEPAYFSYVFKKRYGVSPMKYRYLKEPNSHETM